MSALSGVVGLLVLFCAACTPQLSDAEAERIASEARGFLDLHPGAVQIDGAKLPPAIGATRPKMVYANRYRIVG